MKEDKNIFKKAHCDVYNSLSKYEVYIRNSRGENIPVQSAQFVFDSSDEPYIVLLTDGI